LATQTRDDLGKQTTWSKIFD